MNTSNRIRFAKLSQVTLLTFVLFIFVSGCATLFSDSTDMIKIKSEPSGASVYWEDEIIGKTPLEYELERETFTTVEFLIKKEGYKSKEVLVSKSLNVVSLFNFLAVSSWATDATSGNMIEYSPKSYFVELKPKRKSAYQKTYKGQSIAPFVVIHAQMIRKDLVAGGGEYLEAYARMKGRNVSYVKNVTKKHIDELTSASDGVDFYRLLEFYVL